MDISEPVKVWPIDVRNEIKENNWQEVTSPLIYEPASDSTFHPNGLYSEQIFGQIGSPARMGTLAYIDLHCSIIAPIIYTNIVKIAGWYQSLMEGRVYATWDAKLKDFVTVDKDAPGAKTGFAFFLSHLAEIDFPLNTSMARTNRIKAVKKAIDTNTHLWKQCLVSPAGWRDVKKGSDGRDKIDEVNKLYTSLLIMTREVKDSVNTPELIPFFDTVKYHVQLKVMEIFDYWKTFWEGKTGYGQTRYTKRSLALGTRNVITSSAMLAESPDDPNFIKHNETQTPVYVAAKMFEPKVVHGLNQLFYLPIYTLGSIQVPAVNPDTLEIEYIELTAADVTYALSAESKHDFINSFEDSIIRQLPVTIRDPKGKEYYLWMIYDTGKEIYLFRTLSDLEKLLNMSNDQTDPHTWWDEGKNPPLAIDQCPILTEEYIRPFWLRIRELIFEYLNIPSLHPDITFAMSEHSRYTDGTPNFDMPVYEWGACQSEPEPGKYVIYFNPKAREAIRHYSDLEALPGGMEEWDFRLKRLIAHELAHVFWDLVSEEYRQKVVEEARKTNFTTPYLDKSDYHDKKLEEETFCEYIAQEVVKGPVATKVTIDRSKCRPITKLEMLYITLCFINDKYCTMTRYPAVEMGSIYPSSVVVVTTTPSRVVHFKSQWDSRVELVMGHYPVLGVNSYMEGTTIHASKTPNLDA